MWCNWLAHWPVEPGEKVRVLPQEPFLGEFMSIKSYFKENESKIKANAISVISLLILGTISMHFTGLEYGMIIGLVLGKFQEKAATFVEKKLEK